MTLTRVPRCVDFDNRWSRAYSFPKSKGGNRIDVPKKTKLTLLLVGVPIDLLVGAGFP